MILHFYLRYRTRYGQRALLVSDDLSSAEGCIPMNYFDTDHWHIAIEIENHFSGKISYYYAIQEADGTNLIDGEEGRYIHILKKEKKSGLTILDIWNDAGNFKNVYYTSALRVVAPGPANDKKTALPDTITHEFRVKAPALQPGETVCLLGSTSALKNWDTQHPILMTLKDEWYITGVTLSEDEWPASYKYGIYNTQNQTFVAYEEGENRLLLHQNENTGKTISHDGFVRVNFKPFKGTGVNIPVFSLRSQKSFGVGEFTDLKLLIDWAYATGIKMIQLLPVNDTSAHFNKLDSYPYAAVSSFALHPIYINLEKVAGRKNAAITRALRKKQKQLNDLAQLDYEQVIKFKMSALREIFDLQKEELKNDKVYQEFFSQNQHWLIPYAAYSYLKKKNRTPDFTTWKKYALYDESAVQKLVAPGSRHFDEIAFYYFVQYHLHLQLTEASRYAQKKQIILKGDIPIGIYRNSCDAWVAPNLYNMDEQAGAPPDDFATKGQNWGFPTYNWKQMQHDGFDWWRKRFDRLSNYFDAFRIDHILGFFRIWSIPTSATEGIMGRFVPAIPVQLYEFSQRNIQFNHKRFCNPFINEEVIQTTFGTHSDAAKEKFFEATDNGEYELHPDWNSQQKVAGSLTDEEKPLFEDGLLSIISNVILFDDSEKPGEAFHFRFGMHQTSSFLQLDNSTRDNLYALYIDYFYHRQEALWEKEAMTKLPSLKRSTQMLVCGEDLGMVPHCVPKVMKQLGILSLEVERMPKSAGKEFFHPNDAGYLSIVTPSTHDMSTLREWWTEDNSKSQRFYNEVLGHAGPAPASCNTGVAKEIIIQHLQSPALWSVFLIQDLFAMHEGLSTNKPDEERINIPADPNHYWRYRMPVFLEQLIKENDFNTDLKKIILNSGR